ncbi:rRNA maturation RNase YbeY [Nibricoccus sp. IMCC34717]|uniref:rRNA maturation RNase YbeY n=1 Tax=Nibricoccus sp. IMCC34717 TaxID=3034021 RepID=UPI00384E4106
MSQAREILIRNRHPRLRLDTRALRAVVHQLDSEFRVRPADLASLSEAARERAKAGAAPVPPGELSLVFFDDRSLARLHGEFLDDPTTTDVITFEGFEAAGTAGEICVSADTARRFAADARLDFSHELTLYVVHGWLHLAGYDDLEPAKKRRMRAAEARAMKMIAPILPRFSWKSARSRSTPARR